MDEARTEERRAESTEDVRRGMGSSGFVLAVRRGRKGVYGAGWDRSCVTNDGLSGS